MATNTGDIPVSSAESITSEKRASMKQRLFIMRHAERADLATGYFEPIYTYDPLITESGKSQVSQSAQQLFERSDGKIKHIISSPFTRCIQTASEVKRLLNLTGIKIKVSHLLIDTVGPSAMIKAQPKIRFDEMKDMTDFGINKSEFEYITEPSAVPCYPESTSHAYDRFTEEFYNLSGKYYPESILIVTHGYTVNWSRLMCKESGANCDYCSFVQLKREGRAEELKYVDSFKTTAKQ